MRHEKRKKPLSCALPIAKFYYNEVVEIAEHHNMSIEQVVREMVLNYHSSWEYVGRTRLSIAAMTQEVRRKDAEEARKLEEYDKEIKAEKDLERAQWFNGLLTRRARKFKEEKWYPVEGDNGAGIG